MDYGPVPDDYEKILENFAMNKAITYDYKLQNEFNCTLICSNDNPDYNIFNEKELNIIDYVKKYFKKYNSQKIVEFSHKEKAFLNTDFYKKISYDYAFDISLDI